MHHPSTKGFWGFVQEREAIRLRRREGRPAPWTDDPVLQRYHFCNVRRADDFGTEYYVQQVAWPILSKFGWSVDLPYATILYRLVNSVQWFEAMGGTWTWRIWKRDKERIKEDILNPAMPAPHTPAYITLPQPLDHPNRRTRLIHILDILEELTDPISALLINQHQSLERSWQSLQKVYGVGTFVALQVVRDLNLVGYLEADEDAWTCLGPGAQDALRLMGSKGYKAMYRRTRMLHRRQQIDPPLLLGDVEHCLCEYGKYVKYRANKGKRRYYNAERNTCV